MSRSTDVRTPGYAAIAKKWNLPIAKIIALVNKGAKVEHEHTKSLEKAKQIARDHIAERPDYYNKLDKMEKSPIEMKEEITTSGVRGLGYDTGSPAINPVTQYINTNAMSYNDVNGNNLGYIKKAHTDLHNSKLGYLAFDPTRIGAAKNFDTLKEGALNELGSMMQDGMPGTTGLTDPPPRMRKNDSVDEGKKVQKAKKAVMAGLTAANLYTLGDVAGRASEGRGGSPKKDIVAAATTLPGAAGWGAKGVHYAKKAYDYVKRKKMNEEKNDLKGACWKGYTAKGLKKKGGKMVPNCVPVSEQGSPANPARYTERPTYEMKTPDNKLSSGEVARGIYENIKFSTSHKVVHRDSKKIVAQGTKKSMMKHMKALNAKNPGSHFLGNAPSKKVGDHFTEGYASIGHSFDWAGDVNRKAKFYGKKPKATTTKGDEKDDTYKDSKQGGKVKFAKTVKEDWQKVNRKDKTDGLSQKAVDAYRREHPGSKLKTAVTEKNPSGKRAARRKSFCSRMSGMKARLTSAKTARDPDSNINKALRRWNCHEDTQINEVSARLVGKVHNRYLEKNKPVPPFVQRVVKKKWIESDVGKIKKKKKKAVKEDANRPDIDLQAKSYSGATGTTHTIHEGTKMDNKEVVNEAIDNILSGNLNEMKENLFVALQEKANEKLEERKKVIASQYFGQ